VHSGHCLPVSATYHYDAGDDIILAYLTFADDMQPHVPAQALFTCSIDAGDLNCAAPCFWINSKTLRLHTEEAGGHPTFCNINYLGPDALFRSVFLDVVDPFAAFPAVEF
jgi:hypothetical protein